MYSLHKILVFLMMLLGGLSCLMASIPEKKIETNIKQQLSEEQWKQLLEGKLISTSEEVKGEVWPTFKFYKLMKVSPLQAIAVFADFVYQKEYVPNLAEATIVKVERFNSIQVAYHMTTPWPAPDAKYTTRNILWNDMKGGYAVEWNLIESNVCKETNGMAHFISYEGKTLFVYQNHISPNMTSIATLLKSKAQSDAEATVSAIVNHVSYVVEHDSARLSRQLKLVSPVLLEGKDSYNNK